MWVLEYLAGSSAEAEEDAEELSPDEVRRRRVARFERKGEKTRENPRRKIATASTDPEETTIETTPSHDEVTTTKAIDCDNCTSTTDERTEIESKDASPDETKISGRDDASREKHRRRHREELATSNVLCRVLLVSLDSSEKESIVRRVYLHDMVSRHSMLTMGIVSEVVFSRLRSRAESGDSNRLAIAYLFESWCRAEMERSVDLKPVQAILVNYACTILTEPEITGSRVVAGPIDLLGIDTDTRDSPLFVAGFLSAMVTELKKRDAFEDVSKVICQYVASQGKAIASSPMSEDVPVVYRTVTALSTSKDLSASFALSEHFLPESAARAENVGPLSGRHMETNTLPGMLLSLSILGDPSIAQRHFSGLTRRTRHQFLESVRTLHRQQSYLHDETHRFFKRCCQASATSKRRCLLWILRALQFNRNRTKYQPASSSSASVSDASDSFMLNLSATLLRLCAPFTNPTSRIAEKIDARFITIDSSIYNKDDERLGSQLRFDRETSLDGEVRDESGFHFVTKVYFYALRALHLGPIQILRKRTHLLRRLGHLQNMMRGGQHAQQDRIRQQYEMLLSHKVVYDTALLEPDFASATLRCVCLTTSLLTHLAGAIDRLGASPRSVMLDTKPSALWYVSPLSLAPLRVSIVTRNACVRSLRQSIPQHIVDDAMEILIFVGTERGALLDAVPLRYVMDFVVLFLSSSSRAYLTSPHLRAKLGDLLYAVFLPPSKDRPRSSGPLQTTSTNVTHLLSIHALSVKHLAPGLMRLYGDVEHTGFYDKVNHRFKIAQVLRYLWQLPSHRDAFVSLVEDKQGFEVFANGVINHTSDLLTTALMKLPDIRTAQLRLSASSESISDQERQDVSREYHENERIVTGSLQLANETLSMLAYLTSEAKIASHFANSALCNGLAAMLLDLLRKLAGPKVSDLKVEDPEKYFFRPKIMLTETIQIFLNFANEATFLRAAAVDGHYVSGGGTSFFKKAIKIVRRRCLLSEHDVDRFANVAKSLERYAAQAKEVEEKLDDAPDEFLDALLCSVMSDPVRLPSGHVVDRSTIHRHLLNDKTDPFTREPMDETMLKSEDSLRKRIDDWKRRASSSGDGN